MPSERACGARARREERGFTHPLLYMTSERGELFAYFDLRVCLSEPAASGRRAGVAREEAPRRTCDNE